MTKIKNTKKGMAKKTLSISLVAAMLATSNVPVWASEFSDGSDGAFASEAAPVVEETADVPVAQAVGDAWTIKLTDMPTSIEWNDRVTATAEFTQSGVDEKHATYNKLNYVWRDSETHLAVTEQAAVTGKKMAIRVPNKADYVGKSLELYVWDTEGDWETTVAVVTVTKRDIAKSVFIEEIGDYNYTGKEVKPEIKLNCGKTGLTKEDFNIDYTGSPDLINKGSKVTITVTAVNSELYTGKVSETVTIGQKPASISDFEMSYIRGQYEYTGKVITPEKEDIRVSEVNGTVVDGAVTTITPNDDAVNVGTYTAKASVDISKFENYSGNVTEDVTGKYSVVARNLSNCKVTIPAMASTGKTAVVDPSKITVTDSDGKELTLDKDIKIVVPTEATASGTYTVTITPKDGNKNVTGSTTATLVLYAKDIADVAQLDPIAQAELNKPAYYNGSQITKDASKFVGHIVSADDKVIDTNQYSVEFGTNVNAGEGIVRIVGKNTYEGSVKTFSFTITAAEITKKEATDVVYIKDAKPENYAPSITLTAENGDKKTWTLKEGTDYTVTYKFAEGGNKAGDGQLIATVKYSKDAQTNYGVKETEDIKVNIVNPSLTSANIKMEKTSYEYTGAAIVPEYKVFDGDKELKENVDYVVVNTVGGKDVGTATLVISGKPGSNYNPKVNATATFQITPVSAEKIEVKTKTSYTYKGEQIKPSFDDIDVTLNGNSVKSQFKIVSYGENINAGKEAGTFVLAPVDGNKNFTAGTGKTVKFTIAQKLLTGHICVYDKRGIEITDSLPPFEYDGTEKEYSKVIFKTDDTNVTSNDYEVKYVNNVTGGGDQGASIVVIAKGNYTADGDIIDYSTGTPIKIENVLTDATKNFTISSKAYFTEKEVTVTNPEYAEGVAVKPTIVVKDGAKTLIEGIDYRVKLNPVSYVEPGEKGKWFVEGIGAYKNIATNKNKANGDWEVTKKNVSNLDISVDLDEKGDVVLDVMNGKVRVDNKNFDVKLSEDKKTATVSATTGNKHYIGSTEVTVGGEAAFIEAPVISNVKVSGNQATVILSGDCDGATGYDYVISKDRDCITNKDYDKVNKNILKTQTDFTYTQQGVYYAYCHAWKRGEDGKKIFSDWSNAYPFSVTAVTPDQPVITGVKVSGTTVTVTYTKAANAEGYDVVLGTKVAAVAGEKRPVEYGKLVKKNIKGNTVTATFKNVKKGTYYAGLHAFNRTSENGKKVFSPWSNSKKVVVK